MVDLAEASKVIESDERQMIHSVFELGNTIVREVMVPRTDIVFIEQTKTLRQAMSLALRSGFSRLPVVGENEDDVVGTVYLRDITRRVFEYRESESTERVESLMRPATFVPDSKPADVLLREMQAERIHLVIVVDEYGGTAGLATIEDILEEIVGEITDEHDREGPRIERLADGGVRVTARLPVDELAELFDVEIEDDDAVETVGGLLAQALGRVPIPGATATVAGLELVAEGARGRRNTIASVVVRLTDEARAKSRRLREAVEGTPDAGRAGKRGRDRSGADGQQRCRGSRGRRDCGPTRCDRTGVERIGAYRLRGTGVRRIAASRCLTRSNSSRTTRSWSLSRGRHGLATTRPKAQPFATTPAALTWQRVSSCRRSPCRRCRRRWSSRSRAAPTRSKRPPSWVPQPRLAPRILPWSPTCLRRRRSCSRRSTARSTASSAVLSEPWPY